MSDSTHAVCELCYLLVLCLARVSLGHVVR